MARPVRGSESVGDEGSAATGGGDRLDSWKEIAAFLQRDVRTVQRWEKTSGLPVHRHCSSRLRTAFAYRSELDAWWRAQPPALDEAAAPLLSRVPTLAPGRAAMAGIAAALLAALWLVVGAGRPAPVEQPDPSSPVTVLLTPLEVPAEDDDLARVLDEAVAGQLRQQPGVEMVAPERVAGVLRLMRRDPQLPLPPPLGRELAIRDGHIGLVVAGEIHRLESTHVVHLRLIEPADGRVRASVERQAPRPRDLPEAVSRAARLLAPAVRRPAGDDAVPGEPLEDVTTASLAALRAYSAAVRAGDRHQWAASEMLARRAVAADDAFASAHAWVGWAMRQQGLPVDECLAHLERAMALAPDASEQEIHAIAGAYHEVAGNLPRALAAYEALLRLEPQHRWGMDRLISAYARAGQVRPAAELAVRRAELAPGEFHATVQAAHALTIWQPDPARAAGFVHAAGRLATPEAIAADPAWGAWLGVLPVFHRWMAGDLDGANETLAAIEDNLDARVGRQRDAFATAIGFTHLAFGRLQHAEDMFNRAATPVRQLNLAWLALHAGEDARAREWLLEIPEHSREQPALFARVGLAAEAEAGLAASFGSPYANGIASVARGFLMARQGRTRRAIRLLERGAERLRFSGEPEYFLAIESLAALHQARGRHGRASEVLAEAARQRRRSFGSPRWAGAAWARVNLQLIDAYTREGRPARAHRARGDLERLLRDADAGSPLARLRRGAPRGESRRSAMTVAADQR